MFKYNDAKTKETTIQKTTLECSIQPIRHFFGFKEFTSIGLSWFGWSFTCMCKKSFFSYYFRCSWLNWHQTNEKWLQLLWYTYLHMNIHVSTNYTWCILTLPLAARRKSMQTFWKSVSGFCFPTPVFLASSLAFCKNVTLWDWNSIYKNIENIKGFLKILTLARRTQLDIFCLSFWTSGTWNPSSFNSWTRSFQAEDWVFRLTPCENFSYNLSAYVMHLWSSRK